jgi:hypothetical protein
MKIASIIVKPRPFLNKNIWYLKKGTYVLIPKVRDFIIQPLSKTLVKYFKDPWHWLLGVEIIGSSTSNQYSEDSDLDINVKFSIDKFREKHPQYAATSGKDLKKFINKHFKLYLDNLILPGTHIPVNYHASTELGTPATEGIYDVRKNTWVKQPVFVPLDFNSVEAFKKEYDFSFQLGETINKHLHQFRITAGLYQNKYVSEAQFSQEVANLKRVQKILKVLRSRRFVDKPVFVKYKYSVNWDYRNIVFKILESWGYVELDRVALYEFPDLSEKIKAVWDATTVHSKEVLPVVKQIEQDYKKSSIS